MASQRQLNFALVGCGRIAARHCEALRSLAEQAQLVAVCDTNFPRAQKLALQYGVKAYANHHQMLESHPEIDVLNVLTPSGDHVEHVLQLAPWKKHILVEKPLALSVADAEKMIRVCDENDVRLFVVKQNRTNPAVQKLHQAIVAGRFGKLVMGTMRLRWCRTQEYYDQDAWRGTFAKDGGVLMNQASHHVDLLSWLMGDAKSVFAYSAKQLVNIETEDTAVAVLKFQNGALGVIEATTATRPRDLEGSISILGEKGSVEIGGFAVNEVKSWNFSGGSPEESAAMMALSEAPPNVYGFGHARYIAGVIESICTGKGNAVDGLEGVKSLLLINAMYESMATGQETPLLLTGRRPR